MYILIHQLYYIKIITVNFKVRKMWRIITDSQSNLKKSVGSEKEFN